MEVLECLSFLDLAKFISGNGEQGQIPGPVPALDFIIALMLAETKERIKTMTSEAVEEVLENAKALGIKGITEFLTLNANDLSFFTGNINDSKLKKYETIDVSQTALERILSGEVRNLKQVESQNELDRKIDEKSIVKHRLLLSALQQNIEFYTRANMMIESLTMFKSLKPYL